jgi:hypothetical protein
MSLSLKTAAISTAKRNRVGFFLINLKTKSNNSKRTTNFEINHYEEGKKPKNVFSQNSTNYRITKTSGHIYTII